MHYTYTYTTTKSKMVSVNNENLPLYQQQDQNNVQNNNQPNIEQLSPLDKFNLAIVKANSISDENILPLGIAALAMANENATIDEIKHELFEGDNIVMDKNSDHGLAELMK